MPQELKKPKIKGDTNMKSKLRVLTIIAAILAFCFALTACTPGNFDKGVDKMEKAGYVVVAKTIDGEDCDGGFLATKGLTDTLLAAHFKSVKAATKYYDSIHDNTDDDAHLTQDGKWVYYGSEEAIKTFTK